MKKTLKTESNRPREAQVTMPPREAQVTIRLPAAIIPCHISDAREKANVELEKRWRNGLHLELIQVHQDWNEHEAPEQ